MGRIDNYMEWYGRKGSENLAIAIVGFAPAFIIVFGKATWLIIKGDERGKQIQKELW